MTKDQLIKTISSVVYFPHAEFGQGEITLANSIYDNPKKCKISISGACSIDLTGNLYLDEYVMIGHSVQILTHDHYHGSRYPLMLQQEEKGIKIFNKRIGKDVWLHESIILPQVTEIPDGVVIGAGSVLTKNPRPYEIWAGNPARKIGDR